MTGPGGKRKRTLHAFNGAARARDDHRTATGAAPLCRIRGCGRPRLAHGLCSTHEMRRRANVDLELPVAGQRTYSAQEVQLAREMAESIGVKPAARDLGIPRSTVQHWARGTRRQ